MLRRQYPLSKVIGPRKVWPPVGHGKLAASKVRFKHRSRNDATQKVVAALCPKPGMRKAARHAVRFGQIIRGQRPARTHFLQHPVHIAGILLQEGFEAIRPHSVCFHAVAQQRPDLHRHDRCLVRPLLGELTATVHELVKVGLRVWAQPGEENLIVGRRQHIDVVNLQQTKLADDATDLGHTNPAARPGPIKPLRRQGNATGFAQ